ncbi:MAG TPA: DUF2721 domain-containing protein [Chitinophagaceae bacterium]|nr:DUF2721 domain-containing protein [Chitinophagaceae bacterium]
MEITFNTPALLFPAISLLLLAYTNRYLALANLIRKLHDEYMRGEKNHLLLKQIRILKVRINLVRQMQALSVLSFLCCVITMYGVYMQWEQVVTFVFALSLLSLLASLIISLVEITQSTKALELEISDMEELENTNFFTEVWKGKEENKK